MDIEQSFERYRNQYLNHIDDLAAFLDGVAWDLEEVSVSFKHLEDEVLMTIHRGNKKLMYEARQMIGMIRLLAVNKGVESEGQME